MENKINGTNGISKRKKGVRDEDTNEIIFPKGLKLHMRQKTVTKWYDRFSVEFSTSITLIGPNI
jgi:hypothetical protein